MEQKLAAGRGKGQISELVHDDEVHLGQMLSKPALPSVAGLDLEPVDEVDHVVEAATGTDRKQLLAMASVAGARSTDQDDVALLSDEAAAGEIADERLVDRSAVELEV
jgi:hypothetical protein